MKRRCWFRFRSWYQWRARCLWDWWRLDIPDWWDRKQRKQIANINHMIDRMVLWWREPKQ